MSGLGPLEFQEYSKGNQYDQTGISFGKSGFKSLRESL